MGKISFITKEQKIILDVVRKNEFITSNFYFTGGTALSLYYLQHRYSEDLDFFSEKQLDNQIILTLMEEWSKNYGFTFNSRFAEVVYIFNLSFGKEKPLKIDFARYPYKRLEKGIIQEGIEIDSIADIATNKLLTITQRTDVKDFVDLYFLLEKYTIWDLIEGVRIKFRMKLEPFLLSADFLKVEDFEYLPKMIKPLTISELQSFFRQKAKEVGKRSTE